MAEKNLYVKAVILAYERHKGQKRKVSGEAYINHPLRVSELIFRRFSNHPRIQELRIAAMLHDVIEDTKTTKNELQEIFGNKIAEIVIGLSENKKIEDKEERHKEHLKKLKDAKDEVKIIKLCDICDNVSTVNKDVYWKGYLNRSKDTLEHLEVKEYKQEFNEFKQEVLKEINKKLKSIKEEYAKSI